MRLNFTRQLDQKDFAVSYLITIIKNTRYGIPVTS